jgi:hypothetical protein
MQAVVQVEQVLQHLLHLEVLEAEEIVMQPELQTEVAVQEVHKMHQQFQQHMQEVLVS